MAAKPKGNLVFEIIIVVLILGLIWTIWYPSRVWNEEEEMTNVCRTRLSAIQQMELQYLSLVNDYSDNLPEVRDTLALNQDVLSILDTLIHWDGLVVWGDLKNLIMNLDYPEVLKNHIINHIEIEKPLGNLSNWDSLGSRLITELDAMIDASDSVNNQAIDTSITWNHLFDESMINGIMDQVKLSNRVQRRIRQVLKNDESLVATSAWQDLWPAFYDSLGKLIQVARTKDIWSENQIETWEETVWGKWNMGMDTLSLEQQDSLWDQHKDRFWEKEKDLLWQNVKGKLWSEEEKTWKEDNEALWSRNVIQKWESERKKEWALKKKESILDSVKSDFNSQIDTFWNESQEEIRRTWEEGAMAGIEDTLVIAQFQVKKDSIWQQIELEKKDEWHQSQLMDLEVGVDSLFKNKRDSLWRDDVERIIAEEYEIWLKDNRKMVNKVILDLWNRERQLTWQEEAYYGWVEEKESNWSELWEKVKEEVWKSEKLTLWKLEELKMARMKSALDKLDRNTSWKKLLGKDHAITMINNLQLPDNGTVWKKIKELKIKEINSLYHLGLVGLYREILFDSITLCPVAHVPYVMEVEDTSVVKKVSMECPIVDTSKTIYALKIDTVTKDTLKVKIPMSPLRKIFGGGTIKNHGVIDKLGDKNWDKKIRK